MNQYLKPQIAIEFISFSFKYDALEKPTLNNINLRINKGEKVLIVGQSGSGKSTIGKCLNGLIPHANTGTISGALHILGADALSFQINDYTEKIGTVLQDTDNQFVGLSIGEDIAFALENQLVINAQMYPIVKETAAMVDLSDMLEHSPHELSGGQKQRVSLAGILVDEVDVLLFDEPLAALDPVTSQKTIEIIDKLHSESGKTVVIIEHRLEDVLHRHVDRVILIDKGVVLADMSPDEILSTSLLGEHGIREPLYLSALKAAGCEFSGDDNPSSLQTMPISRFKDEIFQWCKNALFKAQAFQDNVHQNKETNASRHLVIENLSYSYDGEKKAIDGMSLQVNRGEMVSVLGKNGSGKSTLTKLIMGVVEPDKGTIEIDGEDLASLSIFERSQKVGVVMQNPNHMISHYMLYDEVAFGLRNKGTEEDVIREKVFEILKLCGLYKYRNWPIDALSYGQKKRVTIASILVLEPQILILDEPTAGQDYLNYTSIMRFVQQLNREQGITVIVISHDLHLVLEYTTRSIVIADSKLIADAPMTDVFSQPELLAKANLTTTSLYDLGKRLGLEDIPNFMQHFINRENVT